MLTQEQINEVCEFQGNLSEKDEWLFFHLAWANAEKEGVVSFEDKYKIMKKWEVMKSVYAA